MAASKRFTGLQAHFMRTLLLSTLLLAAVSMTAARVLQHGGRDHQDHRNQEESRQLTGSYDRSSSGDYTSYRDRQSTSGSRWQKRTNYNQQEQPTTSSTPTTTQAPTTTTSPSAGGQQGSTTGSTVPPTTTTTTAPAGTQPLQGSTTGTAGSVSDPVLKAVLDLHNQLRAKHGASPVSWNTERAAAAQTHASRCVHGHSQTNGEWNYGESIAWGRRAFTTAVTDEWYSEVSQYNFQAPPSSFQAATAHFTQIVWKATTSLGCGKAECSDGPFYVCQYYPPGNLDGGFAKNVGAPTQQ